MVNSEKTPTVGYIGLGVMGGAMAANLQKAGYQLVVNHRRREGAARFVEAGAVWADTPRALAEQCDVIFTCLPSIATIEQVALGGNGLIEGVRPGSAYFEMSTNSVEMARRLHAGFVERGAHFLDAPISGGPGGAVRAKLAIWVGGDKAVYQRYEPVLRAMGDKPIHIGAIGAGLVTKVVHNCSSQAVQAAIAELFVLGVKAGAEPVALWEAIRQGSIGRRRTFDGLANHFLDGNYDDPVEAALRIVHKDTLVATELGRDLDVPMRIANLALADLCEAMNRGWAERDARAVMLLPQERVGVSIAASPDAIREVFRRDPAAPTDIRFGSNK